MICGRFAPSPSGRMHLGNVYAALMSWLYARAGGGRWILRIEDLDPQRSKPEYAGQIRDDLRWLGLEWDAEYIQSQRFAYYEDALRTLSAKGLVYPCRCTRAGLMATQAPHQSDGRIVYPGTCRPGMPPFATDMATQANLRLYVEDKDIEFHDLIAGDCRFNPTRECGDFVLRRRDGAWAYQLAVVVDDALNGVTQVVRGEDLLLSTAQQIYLYRLLGYDIPQFAHLPLITNEHGLRLSKRDASLSMAEMRKTHAPEEILGKVARYAGFNPEGRPMSTNDAMEAFESSKFNYLKL